MVQSHNRFSQHKELYIKIACFDPNRFKEVETQTEMINLFTIAEALSEVDAITLKEELLFFASNYHQLKQGLFPSNDDNLSDLSDYSDDEEDGKNPSKVMVKEAACKNCLSCAFNLLYIAVQILLNSLRESVSSLRIFSNIKRHTMLV